MDIQTARVENLSSNHPPNKLSSFQKWWIGGRNICKKWSLFLRTVCLAVWGHCRNMAEQHWCMQYLFPAHYFSVNNIIRIQQMGQIDDDHAKWRFYLTILVFYIVILLDCSFEHPHVYFAFAIIYLFNTSIHHFILRYEAKSLHHRHFKHISRHKNKSMNKGWCKMWEHFKAQTCTTNAVLMWKSAPFCHYLIFDSVVGAYVTADARSQHVAQQPAARGHSSIP